MCQLNLMGTEEISETAFLIAWGRSVDPSLSLDPYAHLWLTEKGIRFSEKFARHISPLSSYFFALRSRYIVGQLKAFEKNVPGFTLLNVGAGLTSYPFLLSEDTSVIHLDQPQMIQFYQDRAQSLMDSGELPRRNIIYDSINLNSREGLDHFRKLLSDQTRPAVVLFEGILTYLNKSLGLDLVRVCAERLPADSRVVVHVAPQNFASSHVWNKIGQFFDAELGLPVPELTCFDPQEITTIPGLSLVEHVGFREIQKSLGLEKDFTDDELIDERFFLLEK